MIDNFHISGSFKIICSPGLVKVGVALINISNEFHRKVIHV